MIKNQETIIISLGGSLIIPDKVDVLFLSNFKKFILSEIEQGKRFVIVCGGGKVCRRYQSALKEILPSASREATDWVGIASTKLNAELVKQLFAELACDELLTDPEAEVKFDKAVLIGAGFVPGHSTDYDTVIFAEKFGAKKLINLSNVEFLYDKDPREFDDAVKLEEVNWDRLIEILPDEWSAGLNSPFDPIAARKAKELDLEVAIIKGEYYKEMNNFLSGEKFHGSIIRP